MRYFPLMTAVFLLVLADACFAITLYGKVYDIELNELNGVVVEVNSTPQQRYVSNDGSYSFELNPGEYELTAEDPSCLEGCKTTETVTVLEPGEFVFDLFIFPELDTEDEFLVSDDEMDAVDIVETDGKTAVEQSQSSTRILFVVFAILILIGAALYAYGRKRPACEYKSKVKKVNTERPAKEEITDDNLKQVIEILKKEDGRTTQKELRKQIPLSEAKISLMVAELEHKGIVQKVKKGRGNIIILKKG